MSPSLADELLEIAGGVSLDVLLYAQAKALYREIGLHAAALDSGNYTPFAAAVQQQCVREVFLAIARLYENPSDGRAPRSLARARSLLRERAADLKVVSPTRVLDHLRAAGVTAPADPLIAVGQGIARLLDKRFAEGKETLEAVRVERNHLIAHNEPIAGADAIRPTWGELGTTVKAAVEFLDLVGPPILNTVFARDGEFEMESDAVRPAIAFRRLLVRAGLAEDTRERGPRE
ncbi:MAG: hypothetical protein L0216_00015 [Planctomycetales bacterium]|nr:hypothetical protein [Planctomycetales bacterium]